MSRKLTTEEFIKRARVVHGDKYGYGNVVYTGGKYKIKIFCKIHQKYFSQSAESHTYGRGCPKCSYEFRGNKRKSTTEDFIEKAINIHGKVYSYEETEYVKSQELVKIKCSIHGAFLQTPGSHLNGRGCPICAPNYKSDTVNFIKKAKKIYGEKYDYSKIIYITAVKKVIVRCKTHNKEFLISPNNHLRGRGCRLCANDKKGSYCKSNTEEFIKRSKTVHNDIYNYSEVVYKSAHEKVKILCRKHNKYFYQSPNRHINGQGCNICGNEKIKSKLMKTLDQFISESDKVHNSKYDYRLTEYKGSNYPISIICKIHHTIFNQRPHDHLSGKGCPRCKSSKLEDKTRKILDRHNIKYKEQKKLDKCKYKKHLPFDFYLPEYNVVIECQGKQHFEPIAFWGGQAKFLYRNICDMIKYNYCKREGITLIEIPYWDNTLQKIEKHILSNLHIKHSFDPTKRPTI